MKNYQICFTALLSLMLTTAVAESVNFDVSIDTAPLDGHSGYIAFDLLAGDGVINNGAIVSEFTSDATLGSLTLTGDAAGDLVPGSLLLGDMEFFNEGLQEIVFGSSISFQLTINTDGPYEPFPDAFSLFLLDGTLLPFPTSDPAGADALLVVDIDGPAPDPQVFQSEFATLVIGGDGEIVFEVHASPVTLWPPNGMMIPVDLDVEITGGGALPSDCAISNVTSNEEPIDADYEITAPLSLKLRAKRLGTGDGRIYEIEVTCTNGGASGVATTEVRVPHNLGH